MFPVVVEQIHKFAQVNQSYINIYNLWFFHWRFIWSNVWWKIIIRSVLCDNKKKFIKLMHQKSMIVVIIHWCWKVIFHREDFNNISEFTQRDDRKKRTAKRLCATNVTGLYDLRILWWSSLKSMFSGLLQKDLFKGGWSLSEMFFKQNYCHACHTRFVIFFPLPSCRISSLLAECGCVSTTIIPLCTLPVEPFFRLLDFGALTKDSTLVK